MASLQLWDVFGPVVVLLDVSSSFSSFFLTCHYTTLAAPIFEPSRIDSYSRVRITC